MITHKEYKERLEAEIQAAWMNGSAQEKVYMDGGDTKPYEGWVADSLKRITSLFEQVVGEKSNGWDEKYDQAKEEILKTIKGE